MRAEKRVLPSLYKGGGREMVNKIGKPLTVIKITKINNELAFYIYNEKTNLIDVINEEGMRRNIENINYFTIEHGCLVGKNGSLKRHMQDGIVVLMRYITEGYKTLGYKICLNGEIKTLKEAEVINLAMRYPMINGKITATAGRTTYINPIQGQYPCEVYFTADKQLEKCLVELVALNVSDNIVTKYADINKNREQFDYVIAQHEKQGAEFTESLLERVFEKALGSKRIQVYLYNDIHGKFVRYSCNRLKLDTAAKKDGSHILKY